MPIFKIEYWHILEIKNNMLKLREWQVKTLTELNDVLSETYHKKILLTAPTGSGKSILIAEFLKKYNDKQVLIIVDRIQILSQLKTSISKHIDITNINFLTIQSFVKRNNNQEYDIIIHDEAHTIYSKFIDFLKIYKGILIGLTATPYARNLLQYYNYHIETITQESLIKDKILVPLQILEMVKIDMTNAKLIANEYIASDIQKRSAKIYGDVVKIYRECMLPYKNQRVLIFCANLQHCQDVANNFADYNIKTAIYTSSESKIKREQILKDYDDNKIKILITVATLSKGFDRPNINVIMDLRPLHSSINEYIQMLGRGIRIDPYNTNKIRCALYDFSGNWERFKTYYTLQYATGTKELLNIVNQPKPSKNKTTKPILITKEKEDKNIVKLDCIDELNQNKLKFVETGNIAYIERPFIQTNNHNFKKPINAPQKGILNKFKQFFLGD